MTSLGQGVQEFSNSSQLLNFAIDKDGRLYAALMLLPPSLASKLN